MDAMKRTPIFAVVPALLGLMVLLPGCSQQTLDSAKQDTQRSINNAKPQLAKMEAGIGVRRVRRHQRSGMVLRYL